MTGWGVRWTGHGTLEFSNFLLKDISDARVTGFDSSCLSESVPCVSQP